MGMLVSKDESYLNRKTAGEEDEALLSHIVTAKTSCTDPAVPFKKAVDTNGRFAVSLSRDTHEPSAYSAI